MSSVELYAGHQGERRSFARSSILRGIPPFSMVIDSQQFPLPIVCINISLGGICFTSDQSLPSNSTLDLILDDQDHDFTMPAKILRVFPNENSGFVYGAQFQPTSQEKYVEIFKSDFLLLRKANILNSKKLSFANVIKVETQRCIEKNYKLVLHILANAGIVALILYLWPLLAKLVVDGDYITNALHYIEKTTAVVFFFLMNYYDIKSYKKR